MEALIAELIMSFVEAFCFGGQTVQSQRALEQNPWSVPKVIFANTLCCYSGFHLHFRNK